MKPAYNLGRIIGAGMYPEVTCLQCGKKFPLPCERRQYRFRFMQFCFCSWSCFRQWEKSRPPKRPNIYRDYLA